MSKEPAELHKLIEASRNITERLIPVYRILRSCADKVIGQDVVDVGKPNQTTCAENQSDAESTLNNKQETWLKLAHSTIDQINYVAEILSREFGIDLDTWGYIPLPKWSKGVSTYDEKVDDSESVDFFDTKSSVTDTVIVSDVPNVQSTQTNKQNSTQVPELTLSEIKDILGEPLADTKNSLGYEIASTTLWGNKNTYIQLVIYNNGRHQAKLVRDGMGWDDITLI